jgi:hypothetical protein
MKRSSLLFATLLAAGCDGTPQGAKNETVTAGNANQTSATAQSEVVTDFKAPELAGLAVRDHPQGVQVVTEPIARRTTPPPIGTNDLLWTLNRGAIFTSVNDTPARDARHFRDLMNAVKPGQAVKLGQTLFLEDAGDGQVMIRTTPPEDNRAD